MNGPREATMPRTKLLKRVEDLEIWTTASETAEHFAVKGRDARLRVVDTLAQAEAMLAEMLHAARLARAH
jgi:hypothetical protein